MLLYGGNLISDAITLTDLNECERDFSPPIVAVQQGSHSLPVDLHRQFALVPSDIVDPLAL